MENIVDSILHEYPYPIAKCYEKLVRSRDVQDRYDQVRYLFEVTLKYCACLSIAQYLCSGHPDSQTNTALSCLNKPSLGHWLNLFRLCTRYNQGAGASLFSSEILSKTRDPINMVKGFNAIKEFIETGKKSNQESVSLLAFMETMIAYRNKSAGHGAPQRIHIEQFTPILEMAVIDCILHLDVLKRAPLVYISEIRAERISFVHMLTRLMGTTQVAIRDYVTSREDALLGFDRNLFICRQDTDIPAFTLHPLAIYAMDEVFLLQHSDLAHNVDYLCHHTGAPYSADRIYEDFKERLGGFFSKQINASGIDPEQIYITSVRMSMLDGVIADDERLYLDELRLRLDISDARAQEMEATVKRELDLAQPVTSRKIESSSKAGIREKNTSVGETTRKFPRILFFPYASVRLGFWADIVSRIAAEAHKRDMVFSMVAPDPTEDYDSATMTALVSEMDHIIEMHRPDLIIMVPSPSRPFMDLFLKWSAEFKIPVITIDTEFNNYNLFHERGIKVPPLVQVDNMEGGRMAAQILLDWLPKDIQKPQFLVMPGLEDAPHSIARVRGFEETMIAGVPGSRIRILPAGDFRRQKASKVFEDFLEDADLSRYRAIFCCNDEMALGIYASLCKQSTPKSHFGILGFNNTREMNNAILVDRTGLLIGTIDQNMTAHVETIYNVISKVLKGESTEERYLIKPIDIPAAVVLEN